MELLKPKLIFTSFSLKNGQPLPSADCYVDCRGIPNPIYGGPAGTGHDLGVRKWVRERLNQAHEQHLYVDLVSASINALTTRRGAGHETDKPFVVCCMCAHGIHRSVAMKHLLAEYFAPTYQVEVL